MKHVRWYDKNPDLKEVFEFIERLDESAQDKIATEILQILMCDFNLNLDENINTIARNYNYDCRRWYDENIDLFTSFEIIKGLSENMQREFVSRIVKTIMFIHLEESNQEA